MPTITPPAPATADREQLRELLEGCRLVALTTAASDGLLRSRPVILLEMDAEARLWFFVSASSDWVADLEPAVPANVTVAVTTADDSGLWVSVSGRISVVTDPARVEQLWTSAAEAFFIGPLDPDLRLICQAADSADYWDTKGVSRYIEMAKAMDEAPSADLPIVTGSSPHAL